LATIPGVEDSIGLLGFVVDSECTAGTKDVDQRAIEGTKLVKELALR
jgi:hypothetical protein